MPVNQTPSIAELMQVLRNAREAQEVSINELADVLGISEADASALEAAVRPPDIDLLSKWCAAVDVPLEEALGAARYITRTSSDRSLAAKQPARSNEIAFPVGAVETDDGFNLLLKWREDEYSIPFPGSDINTYREIEETICGLFSSLNARKVERGNRTAIAQALTLAMSRMPEANPSDIYHHIVYRLYLREYKRTDPKQSWVRAGGEGVELFFKSHYSPLLAPYGISIALAFETPEKNKFLEEMGIADQVAGRSKLDICLYGETSRGLVPFAGVHSKASLAERVSDDKPCSEKMIAAGFKSYLFTFDAKSIPPPTGRLINDGELGIVGSKSDKRGYIEIHGSFDACFSYNSRTGQSEADTPSGKRIFTSRFDQFDALLTEVPADWAQWKRVNGY